MIQFTQVDFHTCTSNHFVLTLNFVAADSDSIAIEDGKYGDKYRRNLLQFGDQFRVQAAGAPTVFNQ